MPQPPYSPDLTPTDYHLSKHFQNFLAGRSFTNQDHAKTAFLEFVASRPPSSFSLMELINQHRVEKSAILMVLISTESGEYEESYDRLNWITQHRHNYGQPNTRP